MQRGVRRICILAAVVVALANLPFGAVATDADGAAVTVEVDGNRVTVANGLIERTWSLSPFRTERLVDRRTGQVWSAGTNDFRFTLDGLEVRADQLTAAPPTIHRAADGSVEVTFELGLVRRIVTAYPGIAGLQSRTVVLLPGVLSSYTLDEAGPGTVSATVHSFRAGADWRAPDWEPISVGSANRGDWRASVTGSPGQPVDETAQWLSAAAPDGSSLFLVMERNDQPSSTMAYDGSAVAARVDLSRDIVSLGPFEEMIHAQNPTPGPARVRLVTGPLELEPVFTGVALDRDDEPWQHYAYLHRFRNLLRTAPVVFNSDSVDRNRISTGAKDDLDLAEVRRQAEVAKQLGVEVFILDDGWQAISGDWCPDSPTCPEPRSPRFPPRFPDATFAAVRQAISPMQLGLWMTPMAFHPSSQAFQRNPLWSCAPLGTATALPSLLTPDDGSFEPGIGLWNPMGVGQDGRLIDHIERRILTAIEQWGVTYFKFDFLAWLDCLGPDPVDLYGYRDAFVDLLDRVIAAHPEVTFQIDETNDYRLFPFESIARGPSWFQNGSPSTPHLLHNLWHLAPWVPGATIGQHTFGGGERETRDAAYLMAVALGSHLTFKTDLTTLSAAQVATAKSFVDLYTTHRAALGGFAYPLLDEPSSGTTWTGLQPWDVDAQRGMVLVYRQDNPETTRRIPLRGLHPGVFRVTDARTGALVGTFGRDELAGIGLPVSLPAPFTAAILVVEAVG